MFEVFWFKNRYMDKSQVHLANDDPILALEDAMTVLENYPDDFTSLCLKVIIWAIWKF